MIHQSDIFIKTALELILDDIRKTPWLINDIFKDVTTNYYLKTQYHGQLEAVKEWLDNNKIEIYHQLRNDKTQFPCITISLNSSNEVAEMKTLGDLSPYTEELLPNVIGKPIPYIIKPFVPSSYNMSSGFLGIPSTVLNTELIVPGMILIDPATGDGLPILSVIAGGIFIQKGIALNNAPTLGILPHYQYYKARRQHTWNQESYTIGIHAHGDVQVLLWLHSIVLYGLYRYRESLLETNNFAQSIFSSSDLSTNEMDSPGGEHLFSRYITVTGLVEHSWLMSPQRTIESSVLLEKSSESPSGYIGGIKIASNTGPLNISEEANVNWYPVEDSGE